MKVNDGIRTKYLLRFVKVQNNACSALFNLSLPFCLTLGMFLFLHLLGLRMPRHLDLQFFLIVYYNLIKN